MGRVRVTGLSIWGPPPCSETSLFCTLLSFAVRATVLRASFLSSLCTLFDMGAGNGGGGLGLNGTAFGSRGFLPLVAFWPSVCPSVKGTGLQFSQWCVSTRGVPLAAVPTWSFMHDCPILSMILKGPSYFGPKGVVFPFLRNTCVNFDKSG